MTQIKAASERELRSYAKYAQQNLAYPAVTNFAVGAALQTNEDTVFLGANVENLTLALTVCAERTALFNALMNAALPLQFKALAIYADSSAPCLSPCGPCRQLLREYCGLDLLVYFTWNGSPKTATLAELFPYPTDTELKPEAASVARVVSRTATLKLEAGSGPLKKPFSIITKSDPRQ